MFKMYDCVFCINDGKCDLWDRTNHLYNLRDGTADCFKPHGKPVEPWRNPFNEKCYKCRKHSDEECAKCGGEE